MKKRVLSLFLAITLCLSLTPTGALAEGSLPEQTVVVTQETETPTPVPQKEEPQPGQTAAATQETETPTPAPQKEEPQPEPTVAATQETETPTPAPQKEEPQPEQTVAAAQETETPTPAPQKEESTAPAENGADENASPASPDEKPTENTPAAAEKNPADEGPGKEPAAATGKDESKADGSPSDDDAAKVQNRLVMAAAAEPGEPTMMGQNEPLALNDAEQNGESGGIYVAPGSPTEGGGGIYVSEGDTRTEIWCIGKPSLIQRGYDGTTDGSTIPIDLTFTDDGTNEIELTEGTGFNATKTFDSADAGRRTVTVKIELIGDAAAKYKLQAGQETFTIGGYINKAHPDLNVSLSKTACTAGEKILPLLSVEGAPDGAAVTYYYTQYESIAGDSDHEGSDAMPKIDENTAISAPGTYYVYAKTGETTNYEEERSTTVALTVNEPAAASVTKADGTVSTYTTLPAALNAAQNGETVKLLADHTTNWSAVEGGEYATLAVVKKTLTLDLNGMTVDYLVVGDVVPDEEGGILESYDGNLTVVENVQGGSHGKIKNLEFLKGSLAIQGGRIGDFDGSKLTCKENSGTVTISGGMVCNATVGDGATVTVNGGSAHAGAWFNDGTLSITGGAFKDVQFVNSGTIAISGGTFEKISNNDTITPQPLMLLLAKDCAFVNKNNTSDVQDGTKTSLTGVMVKEHTHTFENGKCTCGVASIVVDNNNSCYNTLQAALDAAANDASITSVTLGQDLTENVTFGESAAESLTLNMNGHKLETEAGAPLTVTGGTLHIEGAGQVNQNTASNANPFPAISLTGGKLVITGDLTAQGGYNSSSGRKPAIYATDGELDLQGNVSLNGGLTITGTAKLTNPLTQGTFYVDASETGYAIAITASDNYNKVPELLAKDHAFYTADGNLADAGGSRLSTGTYTIKPHTCSYTHNETNGMAFCNCGRWHAHKNQSEETSVLVNGICPICGYHCPHNNIGDDGVCTDCHAKMVAKVTVGETTTYTADLADALNKAANGTTITLLADTEISADVNIYAATATGADQMVVTLDLAGHTVTSGEPIVIGADRNGPGSHYGTLKIVGAGTITLDSVSLDTREKGVLDLTGWTGESISSVTVTKIGNTNEGTLIVGKDAGHIGRLAFAFINCSSAEITNTKLYGGSYDEIIPIGNGTLSLAGLLPNGYAFKNTDGSFAKATESKLFHVTVSECDHGGAEGFDNNSTTCPYCGAPAVAETALNNSEGRFLQRRFADLQTAIDADRNGGAELTLLADVTGDFTIDGTKNTGLNLNGHSITGTVTVKAAAGSNTTTLSNTENTTTASIDKVVAYKGAKLAGSGYPAVIGELTLAEGAKWNNILNGTALGYKVLNADGTHKWYARDDVSGSQLNNVIINRLPITSKTLNLKVNGKNLTGSSPKVERGTTVQLCAGCNAKDADVSIYIGETVGNSLPIYRQKKAEYKKIGTSWYYVVDLDANTIGTYDIYFTASKDGYKVTSSHKTLKVTKPDLRNAVITFRSSNESTYEPYRSTTTAPGFTVTHNGKTLKLGVDYTASGTASSAGVSTQTLTIKAVAGSDYTGSKTAEWRIVPHKAKVEVGDVIKAYDGTTNLPDGKISLVSAAGSAGYQAGLPLPLSEGNGFELTDAKYDSANASETEKTISFTVKLTNTNYTFEDGTTEKAFTLNGAELDDKTFKIDKAAIASDPQLYQTVFNDLAKTYKIDLKQFLDTILPEGSTYGDIQYGKPGVSMYADYYPAGGATIGDGTLSLSINKAASFKQGKEIGTVTVQVETTNYQPFTLTIHVSVQDKLVPVPAKGNSVSATDITYGQKLADSKLTVNGTMQDRNTLEEVKGTFAWTDGTIKPAANDSYEAEWTFTPAADYEKYAAVTGTVTVKVKPAKLTVSVEASSMYYTGEEQIASIIATGESVDSTPVTFTYSDKVDGNYTSRGPAFTDAGTYTVYYKAEAANHEPATGTFTVTIAPLPISLRSVSSISKTYDGSADVTLTADKLTFFSTTAKAMNIKLPNTALSFSNAQFTKKQADRSYLPSPEVGGGKALSFTMTLASDNYVFEGKPEGTKTISDTFATDDATRFTITKAAAPTMQPIELTVINGLAKTYLVNLPALPTLGDNCKYGSINYEACNFDLIGEGGYANSTATITSNDEFQLTVPAVESQTEGSVGTVGVKIITDNYQDMLLTVEVIAKNKIVPVLDGKITATPITFGQILRVSTIAGTMKDDGKTVEGTFEWTNPLTKPNKAGDYQAEWTFTPDAPEYATATGTVTIKVNKATPTFIAPTAQENLTYTGQEQALITAGSVTGHSTMQYSLTENGTYSQNIPTGTDAGPYTVWYRVIGDANHNDTEPASVPVSIGKKPLTITGVTAASKPYDGTTNANISDVTFDNVTLNRGTDYTVTANFDDAGVGNDKNVTVTVTLTEQSAAAKNYALEQSSFTTTANITAKEVKVTITPNGGTYGSVTAAAAVLTGVVDGETVPVTLTYTGNGYNSTNVPTDVDSYKVTASIADNNYILTGKTIANFVITPKAVTVSGITAKGKAYDGTTDAVLDCSNAQFGGILGNDTLTVTATGTLESADVGEQNVTISNLTLGGNSVANYVLAESGNQTETTATITAREATVTPDDNQFKVYEEKDPELTYKVSGVLDGETLKGITLTRADGENAGEYAITATADAGANPNYDVTLAKGKFTINPKPIDSATVKLGKGLIANGAEQTQTVDKVMLGDKELPADSYTVTDNTATAPGSYTLTITGKGNYTGTVKQTYAIAPASGKVNVDVQSEGAVPPAALLTDKAELPAMLVDSGDITAEELAQIFNGASVDIVLTVKEANVPDEVKAAMAQAAKGCTIGHYLDISLFKYLTVNGSQQAGVPLHTTRDALTISVVVPDALINTNSAVIRTYYIVRNHKGTITVLDAAFDAASKTLTFKTDRFSDYAIAYKDTPVPGSGSNPGSNSGSSNSSNDSETKKNEVAAPTPTPTPTPTPASTSKPSTITAAPQTGDTFHPTLYVVLLVASLLGLAVVFVCKKRNSK